MDTHRLEVILKALSDEQSNKLDLTYQQGITIAENAKAILKLNDMIVGVSVQLNKLMSEGGTTNEEETVRRFKEKPPEYLIRTIYINTLLGLQKLNF